VTTKDVMHCKATQSFLFLCIFKFTCQADLKTIPVEPCFLDSLDKKFLHRWSVGLVWVQHINGCRQWHISQWCGWQPDVLPLSVSLQMLIHLQLKWF